MSPSPEPGGSDAPPEAEREEVIRYAGLATRVISFVIDAALISVVAIAVSVGAVLIQGVLHLPARADGDTGHRRGSIRPGDDRVFRRSLRLVAQGAGNATDGPASSDRTAVRTRLLITFG